MAPAPRGRWLSSVPALPIRHAIDGTYSQHGDCRAAARGSDGLRKEAWLATVPGEASGVESVSRPSPGQAARREPQIAQPGCLDALGTRSCTVLGGVIVEPSAPDAGHVFGSEIFTKQLDVTSRVLQFVPLAPHSGRDQNPRKPVRPSAGVSAMSARSAWRSLLLSGVRTLYVPVVDGVHQEAEARDAHAMHKTGLARRHIPGVVESVTDGAPEV